MPFVANRGQRIHYTVEGQGPLVVLQHGMFSNAGNWKERGVVGALADRFQVACVDSLGHGRSDKPLDPALYGQAQRASDIVAVIDALGAKRAHVVGYSMGAWIAVGVAKHFPQRLASLVVGGWDLVDGVKTAQPRNAAGPMTFEGLIGNLRRAAPPLVEWVTPETEPAVRCCWEAIAELEGASEAVLGAGCPVMLWDGRDDPYHDPMQAFAKAHGLAFLSLPGDHLTTVGLHGVEAAKALAGFFAAASGG